MTRRARRRAATGAVLAALAAPLTAPAQDEVPFVTTPDHVTLAMLELAGVGANDRLVDLGSGDGRIVVTAARRFGARGLGVDLVPELVEQSRANARAAGVEDRTEFRVQDLFTLELAPFNVVTMYLLPQVNLQLRERLYALAPGTRIVSHDWDLGDWRPDRSVTLPVPDKPLGQDKTSTLHLWVVPARLDGWWCSASGSDGTGLFVRQHWQRVAVTVTRPGLAAPLLAFDGRATADGLHAGDSPRGAEFAARLAGERLLVTRAPGVAAIGVEGRPLVRSTRPCPGA